jgi:hypothetical protein
LILKVGLNVQNLLEPNLKWTTGSEEKIRRSFSLGAACQYNFSWMEVPHHFIFSGDYREENYFLGCEWKLGAQKKEEGKNLFLEGVALRGGLSETEKTLGGGISFGGAQEFQLDYAYSLHDLGNSHRIGITCTFPF